MLAGCGPVWGPTPKSATVETPASPIDKPSAINSGYESVIYVPLGKDVLVPDTAESDVLPEAYVGPFELRSETLAAALQLVLAELDIPIAFETEQGLLRRITVSGLKGEVNDVVGSICGLADLYCSYEDGLIVVRERETFIVSLPPIGDEDAFEDIASGLTAITGGEAIVDNATRTIIYTATNRTSKQAERYFNRLRTNTALIIYEAYIWEVSLGNANTYGINWDAFTNVGKFNLGIDFNGATSADISGTPITLGLPTTGEAGVEDVVDFLAEQGTVKTISQPQLALLSGSSATLRVAETDNFIENLSRTIDEDGDETISTTTSSVDTGLTMEIASSWDEGTVYGTINLEIDDLIEFEDFQAGSDDQLALPRTSERDLQTQVRVRPGDYVLIAGLISEQENLSNSGPGITEPLFNSSRSTSTSTSELVVLLRPRVVVYVPPEKKSVPQPVVPVVVSKKEPVAFPNTDPFAVRRATTAPRPFLGSATLESLNPDLGGR